MRGKVGRFVPRLLLGGALVSSLTSIAHAEPATGSAPFVLPARRERPEPQAAPVARAPAPSAARDHFREAEFLEGQPTLDDAAKTSKLDALKAEVQLQQMALEQHFRELQSWSTIELERSHSRVSAGVTLFLSGLGVGLLGGAGVLYGELEEPSLTTPSVIVVSAAGVAFITGAFLMASGD